MISELIWVVAVILIAGVLLWGINQIPSIDATLKVIVRIAIIVILSIWLIYFIAGIAMTTLPSFRR